MTKKIFIISVGAGICASAVISAVLNAQMRISPPGRNGVVWVAHPAQAQSATIPTQPSLKGAFIGDSGMDGNAAAVLRMIKNEGAEFVVHSGDFDYANNPAAFENLINADLGPNFPYFISPGNHDTSKWSGAGGYQDLGIQRMQRIGMTDPGCITDYGQKSVCVFKGFQILLSGVPYSQFGGDQAQYDFINQKLSGSPYIWKVCSWHEQMSKLTPGSKGDSVPYSFYDLCREKGAFIVNGHAHVYGRTRTINNFAQFSIDPAWSEFDILRIQPKGGSEAGSAFLAESDYVKRRSQARCSGWPKADPAERDATAEGCHIWANIYTTSGISGTSRQGISATNGNTSGAMFITFNVNGDPNKAEGYYKNLAGDVIDRFTITNTSSGDGGDTTPKKGDMNGDKKVDVTDLGVLLSAWGAASRPPADLNQDGKVDVTDLGVLLSSWTG